MSTAQNAATAEAGNGSAKIRARIGDSAIDKVTRLFSAGLADIFTETLQNSRRGGATRVTATIEQDGNITRVTLADDGAGIADPTILLTLGESGWKAGIAEAEDPAGFGLLALSRRSSQTAMACEQAALFGATPGLDEFDNREIWNEEEALAGIEEAIHILAGAVAPDGTQLADQRESLLWGFVNSRWRSRAATGCASAPHTGRSNCSTAPWSRWTTSRLRGLRPERSRVS